MALLILWVDLKIDMMKINVNNKILDIYFMPQNTHCDNTITNDYPK